MNDDERQNLKLLIIGGGNMGTAIASGLVRQLYQPENLTFIDYSAERLASLKEMFPGCHTSHHYESVGPCDIYLLAVKPDQLKSVCHSLVEQQHVHSQAVYLSIAAGVNTRSLQRWLGEQASIIRCMPNTPAGIMRGASGLYCKPSVSKPHRQLADEILKTVGITIWLTDENLLDAVTAVSGSGPAYFFYFMECLYDAAINLGLSETDSLALIKQTALGASLLADQSTTSLAELRRQVTSKGGTTEHALHSFQHDGLLKVVDRAVTAAATRAAQISQEFK